MRPRHYVPLRSTAIALALLTITTPACRKGTTDLYPAPKVFEGYKLLSNPRANIPIGAVWFQDQGPNGNRAAAENIEIVDGATVVNFTQDQRRTLIANVARFIGLTGVQAKNVTVNLSDLKVVRVKDIFQMDVSTDGNILYEGISAGTMTFTHGRDLNLDLASEFTAKGIPVDAAVTTGNNRSVTVNGSNLFLAYRVLKVTTLDRSRFDVITDGSPERMTVSARGLEITADASAMKACDDMDSIETCLAEAPIKLTIVDSRLTALNGSTASKEITVRIGQERNKRFYLSRQTEKELPDGTVFVNKYIQFDIPMPKVYGPSPGIAGDGDSPACEILIQFRPGATSGKVTEVYYQMKQLADPRATGW